MRSAIIFLIYFACLSVNAQEPLAPINPTNNESANQNRWSFPTDRLVAASSAQEMMSLLLDMMSHEVPTK